MLRARKKMSKMWGAGLRCWAGAMGEPARWMFFKKHTRIEWIWENPEAPQSWLKINGVPINLQIDTQVDVKVIIERHYKTMQDRCRLQNTTVVIMSEKEEVPAFPLVGV